jgi:hypothetical protein
MKVCARMQVVWWLCVCEVCVVAVCTCDGCVHSVCMCVAVYWELRVMEKEVYRQLSLSVKHFSSKCTRTPLPCPGPPGSEVPPAL